MASSLDLKSPHPNPLLREGHPTPSWSISSIFRVQCPSLKDIFQARIDQDKVIKNVKVFREQTWQAASWCGRSFLKLYHGGSSLVGTVVKKVLDASYVSQETQNCEVVKFCQRVSLETGLAGCLWTMCGDPLNIGIVHAIEPVFYPLAITALAVVGCVSTKHFISKCQKKKSSLNATVLKIGAVVTTIYFGQEWIGKMASNTIKEGAIGLGRSILPAFLSLGCRWYHSPTPVYGPDGYLKSSFRLGVVTTALHGMLATPSYSMFGAVWACGRFLLITQCGVIAYSSNTILYRLKKIRESKEPIKSNVILPVAFEALNKYIGAPDLASILYKSVCDSNHSKNSIFKKFINITLFELFKAINVDIVDIAKYQLKLMQFYFTVIKKDVNIDEKHGRFVEAFFEKVSIESQKSSLEACKKKLLERKSVLELQHAYSQELYLRDNDQYEADVLSYKENLKSHEKKLEHCKNALIQSIQHKINLNIGTKLSGISSWMSDSALSKLKPHLMTLIMAKLEEFEKSVFGHLKDFSKMKSFYGQRNEYVECLLEIYLMPYLSLLLMLKGKTLPAMSLKTDRDYSFGNELSFDSTEAFDEELSDKLENELFFGIFEMGCALYVSPIKRNFIAENFKSVSVASLEKLFKIKKIFIELFIQPN